MTTDERLARLERAIESLVFFHEQRVKDAEDALLSLFGPPPNRAQGRSGETVKRVKTTA